MIVDPFSYYNNLYSQSGTLKKKYQEGGSSGYESEDSLKSQVSEMIESGESPKTVAAYLSQIGLSESEIRDMFSEYGYSDSDLDELFNSEEETDDLEESDESEQTKDRLYVVFSHELGHLIGCEHLKQEYKGLMNIGGNRGVITKYDLIQFDAIYKKD
jgi:hypothetical protein